MSFPGLELTYNTYKNDILTKCDKLVIISHWCLVFKNKYGAIGIGDKCTATEENKPSECLPENWRSHDGAYQILYCTADKQDNTSLLKIVVVDEHEAVVTFTRLSNKLSGSFSINLSEFVTDEMDFHRAYKSVDTLLELLMSNVFGFLLDEQNFTKEKVEPKPRKKDETCEDPLRIGMPREPLGAKGLGTRPGEVNPFSIGHDDLNPLGTVGVGGMSGGMYFDPMRSGNFPRPPDHSSGLPRGLPPGAVPPGARFDPFGPPGGRHGQGPDPDHLPPPGSDDMFM